MTTAISSIVQRLWNYCNVLRDDGVSYGDYVEQLTYLLFLKMDEERARDYGQESHIPAEYNWASLKTLDGPELETHYRATLDALGKGQGLVATIFRKALNRIQDPAKLRRLVMLIEGQQWSGLNLDVKAEIYEGLLEKNAQDIKSGAGQYFTPRPLIKAIVEVMRPTPKEIICDPACGTGGFLTAAHDYVVDHYSPLNRTQRAHLRNGLVQGWEIVDNTARLCMMNLYLHGIRPDDDGTLVTVGDSLLSKPRQEFSMVLANPPFGKKSSVSIVTESGDNKRASQTIEREDFWKSTSNKQLNFVQHVRSMLAEHGRAAVVVPDNVLFEGGAGEMIRRKLLHDCDVHTLLRLPTGIFYAQGVKANVLFFDRKLGSEKPWTRHLWIYDLRTNVNLTLRKKPLTETTLADFVACYKPENRHDRLPTWSEQTPEGRWRRYSYEELVARDKANLDIFWLRDEGIDDGDALLEPDELAAAIVEDLAAALEQFREIVADLEEA